MAFVACPQCGSKKLRVSKLQGFGQRLRFALGIFPFRCRACDNRFTAPIWNLAGIRYACCPKCYRTELSTWSEQYYHPHWFTVTKLRLGATPYRCEFCRCNFASFLACRERFSWRKRSQAESGDTHKNDSGKGLG
jgi:hypothetical protein